MASLVDYEGEKLKRKVLEDSDDFSYKIPLNCKRSKLFAIREFPMLFGQSAVKSTYDDDSEEELIARDGEDDTVEPDVDDDVGPDMDYYDDVGFDMDDDNDVGPAMDDDDDDDDDDDNVELAVDDDDEPNIYGDDDDDEEDEDAEPYEAENLDTGDELLKVLDNEV